MSNMSYCRFENTYHDLQDCAENMRDSDVSESEAGYGVILLRMTAIYKIHAAHLRRQACLTIWGAIIIVISFIVALSIMQNEIERLDGDINIIASRLEKATERQKTATYLSCAIWKK